MALQRIQSASLRNLRIDISKPPELEIIRFFIGFLKCFRAEHVEFTWKTRRSKHPLFRRYRARDPFDARLLDSAIQECCDIITGNTPMPPLRKTVLLAIRKIEFADSVWDLLGPRGRNICIFGRTEDINALQNNDIEAQIRSCRQLYRLDKEVHLWKKKRRSARGPCAAEIAKIDETIKQMMGEMEQLIAEVLEEQEAKFA
ncbi:MAG: hypothetical protein M1820_004518 [Bogoriella megaspora]|nr:MAG: hypothetical protein M1820_004518 [Bogoriella megaspora]